MAIIDFLLREDVTVVPYLHQGNGEPIYGEPEERKCRMEKGLHLRTTYKHPSGEVVQTVAKAKMFVRGDVIPVGSIVRFTDRFGNYSEMTVIDCLTMQGFTQDHLEVILE